MKQKIFANISLLLAALIWGVSFSAQRIGMDFVGPFTFNSIRTIIGGLVLIPIIFIFKTFNKSERTAEEKLAQRTLLFAGGAACGFVLFLASSIQQIAIIYSTAGKAGFITALYIIFVPILGIFFRQKIFINIFISIFLALIGLYLLCVNSASLISKGDLLLLIAAFIFAVHILIINYYSPKVNCIKLSCIQFLTAGFLAAIPMFLIESPKMADIFMCKEAILYAGIFACAVAYTFQVVGQKYINPTIASLLLSLESVFAVMAGFFILGETLTLKEVIGCLLMISAIVLVQLPHKKKNKRL